jgi:hypothetical protein
MTAEVLLMGQVWARAPAQASAGPLHLLSPVRWTAAMARPPVARPEALDLCWLDLGWLDLGWLDPCWLDPCWLDLGPHANLSNNISTSSKFIESLCDSRPLIRGLLSHNDE